MPQTVAEFWQDKANGFKMDVEHIKELIASETDSGELASLRQKKEWLVNEMMICLEGVEKFSG